MHGVGKRKIKQAESEKKLHFHWDQNAKEPQREQSPVTKGNLKKNPKVNQMLKLGLRIV